MSGKRRAEPHTPNRRPRPWMLALLALTGVFLVVVVVLKVVVDRDEAGAGTAASTPSASPSPTATSPTPTLAAPPTATPTPSPTPSPDLPEAAPAPASRLTVADVVDTGFDESVTPEDDHLIPVSTDEVARWADRGMPGNPATDTVVVVGSVRDDPDAAFARLEESEKGDAVEVTTDEATLTYTVTSVQRRPVADQVDDRLLAKEPGRLVLIGARYDDNGDRMADDVFVVATLSGVVPS